MTSPSNPATSDLLSNARTLTSDLLHDQPLLLGVVGLAIGAGIAALLPSSEIEAGYFGEASDNFKRKAGELASNPVEAAETVASGIAHG